MSTLNADIEDRDLRAIALRWLQVHRRAFPKPRSRSQWHAGWRFGFYDALRAVQVDRDRARLQRQNLHAWRRHQALMKK